MVLFSLLAGCGEWIRGAIDKVDCSAENNGPDEIIHCRYRLQMFNKDSNLDVQSFNPSRLYLDFSSSNVQLLNYRYNANISLMQGNSLMSGRSFSLVRRGQRLYLENPLDFKTWLVNGSQNANHFKVDIQGLEMSAGVGNNVVVALGYYDGQLISGTSDAVFITPCKNCQAF